MTKLVAELEKHCNDLDKQISLLQRKKDSAHDFQVEKEINEYITNRNLLISQFIDKKKLYREGLRIFDQKRQIDSQLNGALKEVYEHALEEEAKFVLSAQNLRQVFDEKGALQTAELIQKYCSVINCSRLVNDSKEFLYQRISAHIKTLFTWTLNGEEFRATISQSFSLLYKDVFLDCLVDWNYESVFEEMLADLATFISTWPTFCAVLVGNELEVKNRECIGWNDALSDEENSNLRSIENFCSALGIQFSSLKSLSMLPFASNDNLEFLRACQKIFTVPSRCIKIYPKCGTLVHADFPKREGNLFLLLSEESDLLVRDLFIEYVALVEKHCENIGPLDDHLYQTLISSTVLAFSSEPIDLESACYRFNEVQSLIQVLGKYSDSIPPFLVNWMIGLVENAISCLKMYLPSSEESNSLSAIMQCHKLLAVWIKGAPACMVTADLLTQLYESFIVSLFMNENQAHKRGEIVQFCNQFVEFLQLYPQIEPFLQSEIVLGILKEIGQLLQTSPQQIQSIAGQNFRYLTKMHVKSLLKSLFPPVAG